MCKDEPYLYKNSLFVVGTVDGKNTKVVSEKVQDVHILLNLIPTVIDNTRRVHELRNDAHVTFVRRSADCRDIFVGGATSLISRIIIIFHFAEVLWGLLWKLRRILRRRLRWKLR